MATEPPEIADLLVRADAEREAGRGADALRLYEDAALAASRGDDQAAAAHAALRAASLQVFGAEPGKLPSLLHAVLVSTSDERTRSRLAAALARCWVYAGEAGRAVPFSDEALERAGAAGDPALVCDALDAALAAHWSPDELEVRRTLAERLDDVAAHVLDPEVRLQAHLWGLQVACEALDLHGMHRHVRALERLGEESPRARFFAASRRLMLDLLHGRTDTTPELVAVAASAADESFIPDAWMVLGSMEAYSAVQAGDREQVAAVAAAAEEFAFAEGARAICAEAAYWWCAAGERGRARDLVRTFHGGALEDLTRDLNWLLTVQCVLEAALAVDDETVVEAGAELLAPYAGHAVVNAGAVMFHGTTDDTLSRALLRLRRPREAQELRARALATYQRIGAPWWRARLERFFPSTAPLAPARGRRRVHLHRSAGGLWVVGADATPVPALRGLGYLQELVRRPWQAVPALDLVGSRGPVGDESGLGELVDRRALAAYRHRLRDLDVEIGEAEDWHDAARLEVARQERAALLDEIGRATGLGGRSRTTGSSRERARVAVRKAISTAIDRVGHVDEALAIHLRNDVHTGLTCTYQPDPDSAPDWVLGPSGS